MVHQMLILIFRSTKKKRCQSCCCADKVGLDSFHFRFVHFIMDDLDLDCLIHSKLTTGEDPILGGFGPNEESLAGFLRFWEGFLPLSCHCFFIIWCKIWSWSFLFFFLWIFLGYASFFEVFFFFFRLVAFVLLAALASRAANLFQVLSFLELRVGRDEI